MSMCHSWLLNTVSFYISCLFLSPISYPSTNSSFSLGYSFKQLRAHLVTIPMTMSTSFVKITVMLGVTSTKPFPRQSVSSSLLLIYVSALSSRQVYRSLIPAETIFKGPAWRFACLPGNKRLFDATPLDVCNFLVFKDSKGKTQVQHRMLTSWSAGFFPLQVPITTGLLHRWLIHWQVTLYIFRHWSSRRLV